MAESSDWVTSSAILKGLRSEKDPEAWGVFVERFRSPIIGFARSLGLAPTDSEDVAQETLLAFLNSLRRDQYDVGKGRLSRWLFGIAYRQCLSRRREKVRAELHIQDARDETGFWENVPADHPTTVAWDTEWERMVLSRCLDRIQGEVQQVTFQAFQLHVCEDRSAGEVAEELGVPVKTIYNAKHRVLNRIRELREVLEETG